jgi:hypothetical protein
MLDCTGDADHRWNAVLTGDDGAVRHRAAHFHHQTTSDQKERRPARICGGGHQDLTLCQLRSVWVEDDRRVV